MKGYWRVMLVMLVALSGCGKKKDPEVKKRPYSAMAQELSRLKGNLDEYVFDDNSKVEEFAFVEEDQQSGSKRAYNTSNDIAEELLKEESEALAFADYKDDSDYDFSRIQFQFNSDELTKGQQNKLHRNIDSAKIATEKDNIIEVRAYGCEMGQADYNLALSQKRANAIKNEMVKHGVPADKINAVGRGQEYQIAWSNAKDRETRIKELSANRRAEMSVSPQG